MRRIALGAACLGLLALPAHVGAANTHSVTVGDFFYKPKRLEVPVGDTVTWNFTDETHNVTSRRTAPAKVRSGDRADGTSFSFTFTKPGRYSYMCTIHPGIMEGVVQVGPDTTPAKVTRAKAKRGKKSVRVSFTLSEDAKVKAVFTRAGKRVKAVSPKLLKEGPHSVTFKPKKLTPGSYRVKITTRDFKGNSGKAPSVKFKVPGPKS